MAKKHMADSDPSSLLTRRKFGWRIAGASAAAALGIGAAGAGEWAHAKHRRQLKHAMDPNVTGENPLSAHAAARGLLYGTAVHQGLLDVDGAPPRAPAASQAGGAGQSAVVKDDASIH
jgi:hypothetical protein